MTKRPKTNVTLNPDPANPNRMDAANKARMAKSLAEFGDLSAIILNRRTGLLIGGHQRVDVLAGADMRVDDLPKPEPDGTVGRGWIERDGRRYALRVVDWPEDKAHAALLAANRFGRVGADDPAILKDLLQDLDTGALDMDLTGYSEKDIERLMLQYHVGGKEPTTQDARDAEAATDNQPPDGREEYEREMADKKTAGAAPIIPMYAEHHQAFVIVCENTIDEAFIRNKLGLESPKQSYKDIKIQQCNVVTGKQFRELFQ
jgi:hypothetical protein